MTTDKDALLRKARSMILAHVDLNCCLAPERKLMADIDAALAGQDDCVMVEWEPLILKLWRESSDKTQPQREIIEYIDALLSAVKEPK